MKLKKALRKKTLLAGGAAIVLLMGSQAAFATTTVAVNGTTSPAADVSVTGPSVGAIFFVTDAAVPMSCSGGTSSGYIKRGASAVSGQKIGAIQSLSMAPNCSFTSLNFPVNITKKGTAVTDEWGIYADGTPAKGATTMNVEIRNVRAAMRDAARTAPNFRCAVNLQGNVSGTLGATVKAKIQLNVVGATDYLIVNTPTLASAFQFPLTLDALNGSADEAATGTTDTCGGEIVDGDKISMVGSFALNQQVAIN
ncbi:hypothetical protein [Aeromicrobium sp. P5_D10]